MAMRGTVLVVASPMTISFTVVYEDGGDGWVTARILEKPAAISQGRSREEARENVRDALRELLLYEAASAETELGALDRESLQLSIAP
jgi:predicted RNase H-like HicB family nuclease